MSEVCNSRLGYAGEEAAAAYLQQAGYVILERNWYWQHKEIDLVCTDGNLVIVVEVKTRSGVVEYPGELLDYKKRRNLLAAGAAYLRCKGVEKELRFDLVIVAGTGRVIQHIREAIQVFE